MDRLFKQIVIGAIYLGIFFSIGYGVKRILVVEPTCFDNVKNGREDGVDCGVVCGKLCDPEIIPLIVEDTYLMRASNGDYDVVSRIANDNTIYGSGKITYDIQFIGRDGQVINSETRRFITSIMPNHRRYVIQTALKLAGDPVSAKLVMKDIEWARIQLGDAPKVDFVLRREEFKETSDGAVFEGVIQNNSDFDFTTVDVGVILLGESGEPVAVNRTEVRTFLTGEERYVKVEWGYRLPYSTARIVEGTTNVFSNENFIKRYGTQEKFQRYY